MKKNSSLKFIYIFALVLVLLCTISVFCVAVGKVHLRSLTSLTSYVENVSTNREKIYGERGYIYDANGQVVAQNAQTYDIICFLSKTRKGVGDEIAYVDDPVYTAQVLSEILGADRNEIYERLTSNPDLYQTELGTAGRNLSPETVEKIQADPHLHGIGFKESTQRIYPLGESFAPYLVGFAQSDENGKLVGKMGVEQYLDTELSGSDGEHIYQSDKNGYILPGMYEEITPSHDGNSVYLTIDASIQEALETAFDATFAENQGVQAWGAVMEVDSGKLLAYGQSPSFDPNLINIEDYNNYGSQYAYEPGSVFKSIIYSAAIDSGVYDGTAMFDSTPFCYYAYNDNVPFRSYGNSYGCINNAGYRNWGSIELDYGLILSSNVATSTLLTDYVGVRTFEEYVNRFQFFTPVDTDGIAEVTGNKNYYYASEKLALTFGQGSSVTMLQLLRAYSAIFGNGEMVKPYFIDHIVDAEGNTVYQAQRTVVGTPIKESTAKQMQALLARVVSDPIGTAKFYGIDEVNVAAKTGTSEIAVIGGGYNSDMAITSVMMGLPAEDPQIMIYFAYIAPYDYNRHAYSGPINELTRKVVLLTKMNLKEEYSQSVSTITRYEMPSLIGSNIGAAGETLEAMDLDVITIGDGLRVRAQIPEKGKDVYTNQKVFLLTDGSNITLPDFSGWTRKEVMDYWKMSDLSFALNGYGVVTSQSPEAGTLLTYGQEVEVTFQDIHTAVEELMKKATKKMANTTRKTGKRIPTKNDLFS